MVVMITTRPVRERLATLDRHRDQRQGAVRRSRPASISAVGVWDLPGVSPPQPPTLVRRAGPVRRHAVTRQIRLLTAILWFLASSWQRRRRTRRQMQLGALSSQLLKDIGLRREHVAQGFAEPYHGFE
jgi:uncharacterized protein YjiS (DUF1127 family)